MDKNKGQGKTLAKIICVLLSFGLWLYVTNIENPIKTNDITGVEVQILNDDELAKNNLSISPNQKYTVDLKIEGKSSDVYRASKNDFKVVADLGAYALKKGDNIIPVQIVKSPDNVSIRANNFLGIKVNVEELKSKDMNLTSDVKVYYKDGVYENEGIITPQKVKIEGAASLVDKVAKVSLVGEVRDVSEGLKKTFPIKAFDDAGNEIQGLKISETEGNYEVKVSNGKKVAVKAKVIGSLGSGLSLDGVELTKSTIEIVGTKDLLKTITSVDTEPIDISGLTDDKDFNVKVVLPQGVKIINGNEFLTAKVKVSNNTISKEIEVPTNMIGLDDKFKVDCPSNNVKVKVIGPANIINNLTASDIQAQIDLKSKEAKSYEDTPEISLVTANPLVKIEALNKIKYTISLK